jgi:hypothetical protein
MSVRDAALDMQKDGRKKFVYDGRVYDVDEVLSVPVTKKGAELIRVGADEKVDVSAPKPPAKYSSYQPEKDMLPAEQMTAGIGRGIAATQRGLQETVLGGLDKIVPAGTSMDQWVQQRRSDLKAIQKEAAFHDKPLLDTLPGSGGDIVGASLPGLVTPVGGVGAAAGPVKMMAHGAVQGLANALISEQGQTDPTLYYGGNIAGGAVIGPLMHAGGKVVNAGREAFRKFVTPTGKTNPVEAYTAAKTAEIPTTIGDIDPASKWRSWENFTARVPFSGRKADLTEQANAISNKVGAFVKDREPLAVAQGEDPGRAMFDSVQREYRKRKGVADQKFDAVNQAAQQHGVDFVTPDVTHQTASQIVQDFGPDLFNKFGDQRLTKSVNHILGAMDPAQAAKNGPVTFDQMRKMRSLVGEKLRQAQKMQVAGNISDGEVAGIAKLYDAVGTDLDNWGTRATQNQVVMDLFNDASEHYRTKIDPFKRVPLLNQIRNHPVNAPFDTDKITRTVAGRDKGAMAEAVLNQMDDEGRKIAEHTVLQRAADKGLNPNIDGGLSTTNLLNSLDLGNTRNKVLSPATRAELEPLETSLRVANRASGHNNAQTATGRMSAASLASAGFGIPGIGAFLSGMPGAVPAAVASGAALTGARASNMFSKSDFGKRFHLADPMAFSEGEKILSRTLPAGWEEYLRQLYGEQ